MPARPPASSSLLSVTRARAALLSHPNESPIVVCLVLPWMMAIAHPDHFIFQLLHCLEFAPGVKGGESTFLDAFAAAEHFRDKFPDKFEVGRRCAILLQLFLN